MNTVHISTTNLIKSRWQKQTEPLIDQCRTDKICGLIESKSITCGDPKHLKGHKRDNSSWLCSSIVVTDLIKLHPTRKSDEQQCVMWTRYELIVITILYSDVGIIIRRWSVRVLFTGILKVLHLRRNRRRRF